MERTQDGLPKVGRAASIDIELGSQENIEGASLRKPYPNADLAAPRLGGFVLLPYQALDIVRMRQRYAELCARACYRLPMIRERLLIALPVAGCAGVPAAAFGIDRRHFKEIAEAFLQAGFRSMHVDGEVKTGRRARLIGAAGTDQLYVLTNCGLVSEGVDVPAIATTILLRPTKSLTLCMQQGASNGAGYWAREIEEQSGGHLEG